MVLWIIISGGYHVCHMTIKADAFKNNNLDTQELDI